MSNNSDYRKLTDYIKEVYAPNKVNWGHMAKQIDSYVKGYNLTYLQIIDIIKYAIEYEGKEVMPEYGLNQWFPKFIDPALDFYSDLQERQNFILPEENIITVKSTNKNYKKSLEDFD